MARDRPAVTGTPPSIRYMHRVCNALCRSAAPFTMHSRRDLRTSRVLRDCAAALGSASPAAAPIGGRQASTAAAPAAGGGGGRMAGKTAIVTGAAHGIGKATATLFASEGARVILADRDVDIGTAVAELITAQGREPATFVECDVSDEDAVKQLIEVAQLAGGVQIDALVNVAGVDIIAKLEDTEPDRWDRVMQVNLRSVFLTSRAALPYLRAAGRSAIVNVSSIQGSRGFSGYPGYAATKAGILGFTRQIAVDYATAGIVSRVAAH